MHKGASGLKGALEAGSPEMSSGCCFLSFASHFSLTTALLSLYICLSPLPACYFYFPLPLISLSSTPFRPQMPSYRLCMKKQLPSHRRNLAQAAPALHIPSVATLKGKECFLPETPVLYKS